MRYAPPGLCLNDFALIERPDGAYEVLHLQGPWTPRFVHFDMETSYGRAESTNLVDWTPLGPGFGLGAPGGFDGSAVWTMHPFPHGEGSVMFYTGFSDTPFPRQTIGMARSARRDGTGWRREQSEPVVVADARWYRTKEGMGWRDPFVAWAEEIGAWVMVICASDASLPLEVSGAVAWATSTDLVTWEVQPPLISPGDVNELECPVLERTATGWLLLGCLGGQHAVGTWSAEQITGPWRRGTTPWPAGPYAPRLVTGPDGSRLVVHTVARRVSLRDDGEICRGMLAQPKLLVVEPTGDTHLAWWHGLDEHFVAEPAVNPDAPAPDIEARYADVPAATTTAVRFRTSGGEPVAELQLRGGQVSFGVAGAEPIETAAIPAATTTLRVLTVGEYVEVYADSRLVMSAMSYRGTPTRIDAVAGTDVAAVANHVRPRQSPRDDASAIWPV